MTNQDDDNEPQTDDEEWELTECKRFGDHLKSCDEDGYCNLCGYQDE